jgi:hypothetical protein
VTQLGIFYCFRFCVGVKSAFEIWSKLIEHILTLQKLSKALSRKTYESIQLGCYCNCLRGVLSQSKIVESITAPPKAAITRICVLYPSAYACRVASCNEGANVCILCTVSNSSSSCRGVRMFERVEETCSLRTLVQIAMPTQPPRVRNWPTLPIPTAAVKEF